MPTVSPHALGIKPVKERTGIGDLDVVADIVRAAKRVGLEVEVELRLAVPDTVAGNRVDRRYDVRFYNAPAFADADLRARVAHLEELI